MALVSVDAESGILAMDLAADCVPLILRTAYLGYKDRREQHKRWAKVATPIWLYVSVTGVVIYWMLYH